MDRQRAGRRQLPTAAGGGMQRRGRASCGFLFLSRSPAHWLVSRAPALFLLRARSLCARHFLPRARPLSFFSCRFSRIWRPPRTIWANRTPNRRFLDATVIRRTPYGSKASRLLRRPAWSALALKRRQSDDKATP